MKKYVKRGITAVCILGMMFSLAACGKKEVLDNILNETGSAGQEITSNGSKEETGDEKPAAQMEEKVSSAEEFTYVEENGEIVITGYTGTATVIQIPESIEGKPVTVIGEKAFAGKEEITEVIMPDSIVTVRNSAFSFCYGLTKVTLSQNLQTLEYGAFYLSAVEQIELPDTLVTLGGDCLNGTDIKEVTIPPMVTEISNGAFAITKLESIIIPSTVQTIGEMAFQHCDSLKSVVIEEGVEVIGDEAFSSCEVLESISFPASATDINEYAVMDSGTSVGVKLCVVSGSEAEKLFSEKYGSSEHYKIITQ